MSTLTNLGIACAIVAIANALTAVFYAWHGDIGPAAICIVNFALLGSLVQLGVFG